jgi:hypothetical protein
MLLADIPALQIANRVRRITPISVGTQVDFGKPDQDAVRDLSDEVD